MIFYTVTFDCRLPQTNRRYAGNYEIDADRQTLANVIEDIRSGQMEDVAKVYESEVGGMCRDITENVAREILALELSSDEGKISDHLESFLTKTLGTSRVLSAEYADRAWRAA
jgi:hypothetical protein